MTLFSIYFQSGEFFNQGDSNFFWKMLPSIVGSLIGFGGSLFLYYKKNKYDKEKDDAKKLADKNEQERNTLNYFIALLKSVLKISVKQADNYKEHADNLTNKPFEYHLLKTVIAEDINRILHQLEHERIFHSYLGRFGNDIARIEKFQKLFGRLDFIEATYKEALRIQEKLQEELLNKKIKYKELGEEDIRNYCALLQNAIKYSDPNHLQDPFYNLLNNSIIAYHKNKPDPETLEYMQSAFIQPVKVAIIENFRHIPEAMLIADNCRKATWLFNEIKMRSETLGKDFYRASDEMKKTHDELQELTSDITGYDTSAEKKNG